MQDWIDAEDSADEALRHAELLGEPSLLALVLTGRAEIRVDQGEVALAGPELDRAARLAREAGDELGIAEVRRLRALSALRRGDAAAALPDAEAAYETAVTSGAALLRADAAAAVALTFRRLGRPTQAEERRKEAVDGYRELGAVWLADRFERLWDG
jgi:tetratricopeptide (TPR) repeat protein